MSIDSVIADVAAAVGLAEGPAGVGDVLRAIARSEGEFLTNYLQDLLEARPSQSVPDDGVRSRARSAS